VRPVGYLPELITELHIIPMLSLCLVVSPAHGFLVRPNSYLRRGFLTTDPHMFIFFFSLTIPSLSFKNRASYI